MINSLESMISDLFSVEVEEKDANYTYSQIENIARICHEANCACNIIFDENFKNVKWENAPKNQQESCISGVKFHLENPNASPRKSHEKWLKDKKDQGWKYGPEKDGIKKTHPRLVDYDKLSKAEKLKDILFSTIVNNLKEILK